jgi:peptide chain release factor 3
MSEYGVKTSLEPLAYEVICWLEGDKEEIDKIYWGTNAMRLTDHTGAPVVLIMSEWNRGYLEKQNPKVKFLSSPSSSFTALASGV